MGPSAAELIVSRVLELGYPAIDLNVTVRLPIVPHWDGMPRALRLRPRSLAATPPGAEAEGGAEGGVEADAEPSPAVEPGPDRRSAGKRKRARGGASPAPSSRRRRWRATWRRWPYGSSSATSARRASRSAAPSTTSRRPGPSPRCSSRGSPTSPPSNCSNTSSPPRPNGPSARSTSPR
ncbi:hypothetical protein ACFQHO_27900 [Actinomadura yumaensis]|uniref:hypothetical protein n=1 Tax=Actinomadura yumaensis TaxID=111807 RepID=UPI00361C34BE